MKLFTQAVQLLKQEGSAHQPFNTTRRNRKVQISIG